MKIPTVLITDVLETRFTKGLVSFVKKDEQINAKNYEKM
jgi:hypothetical protein